MCYYKPLTMPLLVMVLMSSLFSLTQVTVGLHRTRDTCNTIYTCATYWGWPRVTQDSVVLAPSATATSPLDRLSSMSGGTRTVTQPTWTRDTWHSHTRVLPTCFFILSVLIWHM